MVVLTDDLLCRRAPLRLPLRLRDFFVPLLLLFLVLPSFSSAGSRTIFLGGPMGDRLRLGLSVRGRILLLLLLLRLGGDFCISVASRACTSAACSASPWLPSLLLLPLLWWLPLPLPLPLLNSCFIFHRDGDAAELLRRAIIGSWSCRRCCPALWTVRAWLCASCLCVNVCALLLSCCCFAPVNTPSSHRQGSSMAHTLNQPDSQSINQSINVVWDEAIDGREWIKWATSVVGRIVRNR